MCLHCRTNAIPRRLNTLNQRHAEFRIDVFGATQLFDITLQRWLGIHTARLHFKERLHSSNTGEATT
jgi:hypothetical protein